MIFDSYDRIVFYDGAMGTMLQNSGLKAGERSDILNITNPDAVYNVHRMYVEAGSDIVCTNTFGANADTLQKTGYSPEEIISAAVAVAKRACGKTAKVALDIGPTGQMLKPLGELDLVRAYELFCQQALAGEKAGADFAAIETMSDLEEFKAALLAVKKNTALPVLATMTFGKNGHTFTGCSAESFSETAKQLGADAVGLNCSYAPADMLETASRIAKSTDLPLIVKLNAGLPDSNTGRYSVTPEEFARQMIPYAAIGAKLIGGCCGTTPEYIRQLRKALMLGETI